MTLRSSIASRAWRLPPYTTIARPPIPPSPYDLPGSYTLVTTTAEFKTALAGAATDIVLADGTYDDTAYINCTKGHRIYAQNLGGAVLTAALAIGSNTVDAANNAIVRGISFNVTDPAKEFTGRSLSNWGYSKYAQFLDLTFDGAGTGNSGLHVTQPIGVRIHRIEVRDQQTYGVFVSKNDAGIVLADPVLVSDILAIGIKYTADPGFYDGTAEAGVWIGEKADVRRIKIRDCGWMGLWTGSACNGSRMSDIDIDDFPAEVGIYCEHYTDNSILSRYNIGPNVRHGINCEWSPSPPASLTGTIFEDGRIDTTCVGIYMDQNCADSTARRTRFFNQDGFCLGSYLGDNTLFDTAGNDYSGRGGGADVTTNHISSMIGGCS